MAETTVKRPVLVVDDEPEMLFSLQGLLRREFKVFTAGSGADGLRMLKEHDIHIVLTDQRMPEMTGVELLTQLKNEHPHAIRMIFTGYADTRAVIDAINQGNVFRFVAKPWEPDELLKTLREAGKRHDDIVEARRLLLDMRTYEARCIAFDDEVRSGRAGTLTESALAEAELLSREGQVLIGRITKALEVKQPIVGDE